MAGFHTLLDVGKHTLTGRTYKPLLQPGQHKIIGFAQRTQGLMVPRGNPLGLHSLHDVVRLQARFANRSLGSGTRVVLDELLALASLPASQLRGHDHTEPSHTAVAQAVAAGQCDVGLGIAAAAGQAGLDFVPLGTESYHLVCLKSALEQPALRQLRGLLQSPAWLQVLQSIPGYRAERCGEVLSLSRLLPWWRFAPKKCLVVP